MHLFLDRMDFSLVDSRMVRHLPRMPPPEHELGRTLPMSSAIHNEPFDVHLQRNFRHWGIDTPTTSYLEDNAFHFEEATA